jgi:hypothetical protein
VWSIGGACVCVLLAEAAVGRCGVCGCVWVLHVCAVTRVCMECVQRDGRTALYVASQQGKEEVVGVLVSSGAAVNAATV